MFAWLVCLACLLGLFAWLVCLVCLLDFFFCLLARCVVRVSVSSCPCVFVPCCLYISVSVCLSAYLFSCLSVCLSVRPSVRPSVCLSVCFAWSVFACLVCFPARTLRSCSLDPARGHAESPGQHEGSRFWRTGNMPCIS